MQVIVILDSQIRRLRPRGQGRGFRYKAWFRQQGGHAGLAQWSLLGDAQPQLSLPPSTLAHCRGRTEVPFPGPGSIQTLLLCDLDQNTEPLKASALGKDVNKVVVNIRWYGLWKAAGPVPGT